jgi:hypothetical protein
VHYLLLIAALPILGYRFGLGNQVEQFSLVRRLSDPSFLPGDFYINSAAVFGPRYYYCLALSWLTKVVPLPAAIFILTYVTNAVLAAISFDAARRHLRADRIGGAIAALLVIANSGFALGLAAFIRFESYQPANIAIPLALFGLSSLLARRRLLAAVCFAAAALFHPLVGVETAAIGFAACGLAELASRRPFGEIVRAWMGYLPAAIMFGAAAAAEWVRPASGELRIPDAEFFAILPLFRAPHHYLALGFPLAHYLMAGLFVAGLAYLVAAYVREKGLGFEIAALAAAAVLVLALCAASALFVDILHNRAVATAQVFRMLLLVKWIGFLLFAWAASRWIAEGGWFHWLAALVPVLVTGDAQPLAMVASICAMEAARRLKPGAVGQAALAGLLVLFSVAVALKFAAQNEIARAAVGAICLWLFFGTTWGKAAPRVLATALVAGVIALGWVNRDLRAGAELIDPPYSWDDLRGSDADIARWAKANTPPGGVWLTPPDFESFRLLAERAIVVDYTSIPFKDAAMREWRNRMRVAYGDVEGTGFTALHEMEAVYRASDPARLGQVGARYGATYAVLYADTPWPGPTLYRNADYKAVRLAAPK